MDKRKMTMSVEELARKNCASILHAQEEREASARAAARAAAQAATRTAKALASAASSLSLAKRVYNCRICSLTFKSSQALGGHMAYHAKVDTPNADRVPLKDAKIHECMECHARFSIRLALIGHQRKHAKARRKRRCVRKAQTPAHPVLPFDLNRKPVLPFDLNVLPPPED